MESQQTPCTCGAMLTWSTSMISTGKHGRCDSAFCDTCHVVHLRGDQDAMAYVRMVWRNSSREADR